MNAHPYVSKQDSSVPVRGFRVVEACPCLQNFVFEIEKGLKKLLMAELE